MQRHLSILPAPYTTHELSPHPALVFSCPAAPGPPIPIQTGKPARKKEHSSNLVPLPVRCPLNASSSPSTLAVVVSSVTTVLNLNILYRHSFENLVSILALPACLFRGSTLHFAQTLVVRHFATIICSRPRNCSSLRPQTPPRNKKLSRALDKLGLSRRSPLASRPQNFYTSSPTQRRRRKHTHAFPAAPCRA